MLSELILPSFVLQINFLFLLEVRTIYNYNINDVNLNPYFVSIFMEVAGLIC